MSAPAQSPVIVTGGSNPLTMVLGFGALALIGVGAWKLSGYLKKQEAASQLKKDQASTVKPAAGKKMYDLNGKPITSANLGMIATDIRGALKFPTDDARAVRAFKNTPFGFVNQLETLYLNKYGEDLKAQMEDDLEDEYWIQVKHWFK